MKAADLLAKAKAGLILDQPFFASLIMSMPFEEDATCETMATDGDKVYYNTSFVESMDLQETTFVLGHETMHCVFEDMLRMQGVEDPSLWNAAADYIINGILVDEKVGRMPKVGLLDPALVAKGGATTRGVYNLLLEKQKKQQNKKPSKGKPGKGNGQGSPGPGQPGGPLDELRVPSQDKSVLDQKAAEMRVKVIQARNAAKMCGKLSAGMDRLVTELTKTETDWRSVLRRFITERAKNEFSFARPKRRFMADDIFLPSLSGETLGCIVIAVDCSGSVGPRELAVFEAETRGVLEDAKASSIKVIYFDSEVCGAPEMFTQDDEFKLTPRGGGGTAFSPIFELLNKDETAPVAVVVLTDLECDDYGPAPSYPVLWASTTNNDETPFGEVIRIKTDARK